MSTEAEFYKLRDRRTNQVGAHADRLDTPITVRVGPASAQTRAGQVCLLALVDLLARLHRHIDLGIAYATLADGTTLADAAVAIARAINPYIDLAPAADGPSVGIGGDVPACTWHLGARGWLAVLDRNPQEVRGDEQTIWGAMLAACFGSAAMYWHAHGHDLVPTRLSLWDLGEDEGPPQVGPLDIGSVVVVGAGAVGAGLAYWLNVIGVVGAWTFVDGDRVELHNTNRSMGYTATDAGWPGSEGSFKANVAARLARVDSFVGWYHDWMASGPARPDLIVTLANGAGVRHVIGQRMEPILLHASTSREFTAELHRHRPTYDQCIACRFPDPGEPLFECSTAPMPKDEGGESADAALPFLSATAALLLVGALSQLPDGPLLTGRPNHWRLHLVPGSRLAQAVHWDCSDGCVALQPHEVRKVINYGRRWAHLDRPRDQAE